jgi:hypothetical protein
MEVGNVESLDTIFNTPAPRTLGHVLTGYNAVCHCYAVHAIMSGHHGEKLYALV